MNSYKYPTTQRGKDMARIIVRPPGAGRQFRHGGFHSYHRGSPIPGFVGGVFGGLIGSAIANSNRDDYDERDIEEENDARVKKLLDFINTAPPGATVKLTPDEFKLLSMKQMVYWQEKQPFVAGRMIEQ